MAVWEAFSSLVTWSVEVVMWTVGLADISKQNLALITRTLKVAASIIAV